MKEIEITKQSENQRVDKFIYKYLKAVPTSFVQKMFRKKDIKINGKPVNNSYLLKENDVLRIYITDQQFESFSANTSYQTVLYNLDIIYEDENILLVNKQAGDDVQDDGVQTNNLTRQVISYLIDSKQYTSEDMRLYTPAPIHRLDRNTSGLVIFGKNLGALQILNDLMKQRKIKKNYLTIVKGQAKINDRLIDYHEIIDGKPMIARSGKEMISEYTCLSTNGQLSLLDVYLVTGRKHQIRLQLSAHGLPILGDHRYGYPIGRALELQYRLPYQLLHAYKIEFSDAYGCIEYLKNKVFTCFPKWKLYNELINQGGRK